jgi:hypothetical protein
MIKFLIHSVLAFLMGWFIADVIVLIPKEYSLSFSFVCGYLFASLIVFFCIKLWR